MVLRGFSKTDDNYLFLDIEKGKDIIEAIHDELYSNHFKDYYLGLPYIPHMTVGKLNSEQELNNAYEYVKNIDDSFQNYSKEDIGRDDRRTRGIDHCF